ncbi:MAG: hypothetical protein ABIF22_01070 [bacterium]
MKILLIEDDEMILDLYKERFYRSVGGKIILLIATSIIEARELFEVNKDIKIIIFDGCIKGPGKHPNTLSLVDDFRRTFNGHMISVSNRQDYRSMLFNAGCDYQCNKEDVCDLIVKFLYSE